MSGTKRPSLRIQCDVLIVGGGTAALVAALEARKSVDRVVVACKRKPGRSGNTIVSGAAFSACVPGPENPDSVEQHLRDILEGGAGIGDPELAGVLAAEAPEGVMGLRQHGVEFLRHDGALVRRNLPGHSRPRSIPTDPAGLTHHTRGLSISLPLLKAVRERGVELLSDLPVCRLEVWDGAVHGALALDVRSSEEVILEAKAVVLAAGGGGYLFSNTNNTLDMTGDSYALALETGVPLRDMEMVQFYPCMISEPVHGSLSTGVFGEGAVLRNRHGEKFMARYDPTKADMATRDVVSQAIFHEVRAGNGVRGGVYVDLSAVPPLALERRFATLVHMLRAHSVDPARDWPVISPATHFLMGGAWIDARCRTGIDGLFAAGEAAGGVHGANRLSGNALSEAVVFGARAGREAAAHARRLDRAPRPEVAGLEVAAGESGSLSLAEVKAELQRAMWDHASIVRTEAGLRRAQSMLEECSEALPRCRVAGPGDEAAYLEIERMALVGQAIVVGALERTESRGAHHRGDYPSRDDARWLGSTRVAKEGASLKVTFVPLVRYNIGVSTPQP